MNQITKLILITIFSLSIALHAEEIAYSTGLQPEPYELVASLKEANPLQVKHRGLPSSVDLSDSMPPVGFQGKQSSCVAWSTAYAAKSYEEYAERKKTGSWSLTSVDGKPNYQTIFSPAFIYNQINGGKDNGSSIFTAMKLVVEKGAVPWEVMPYNADNYTSQPNASILETAAKYKAASFLKVRSNEPDEIKAQLNEGRPVVVGLVVYENFNSLQGKQIYNNAGGKVMGGHAVTIVGYDDSNKTFKFINSWSDKWGDKGYGYIDYKWFTMSCKAAYVLIDATGNTSSTEPEKPVDQKEDMIKPPTEIHATQGNFTDKIIITWNQVENAIGYEIYRKSAEENFAKVGLSTKTTFADTGIKPGISYSYKVASVFENKVSDPNEGEVSGYASTEGGNKPAKVTGLKASSGNYTNKIILSWEPQNTAKSYNIFKYINANYAKIGSSVNTTFTDLRAAKNGAIEYYRVAGVNENSSGEESDSVTGFTIKYDRPAPPTAVTASQGEFKDKVAVKWKPADNATDYVIYKFLPTEKKWQLAGQTNTPLFEDKKPERGVIYYSVAAKKDSKWSKFSTAATGFIDPNIRRAGKRLSSPENFSLMQNGNTIKLNWSRVQDAEEYNLWIKKIGDNNWKLLGTADDKAVNFTTSIPEKEKFYLFSITAKSMLGGDSEYADPVSAVVSEPKMAVTSRSFGGESKLEKFKGKWTAMQWDGAGVKNVVLEINGNDENSEYKVTFNQKVIFQGKYIQDSTIIQKDGFNIKLAGDEDSLLVKIKDAKILSKKDELAFLKE